jgi:hypothetical protein
MVRPIVLREVRVGTVIVRRRYQSSGDSCETAGLAQLLANIALEDRRHAAGRGTRDGDRRVTTRLGVLWRPEIRAVEGICTMNKRVERVRDTRSIEIRKKSKCLCARSFRSGQDRTGTGKPNNTRPAEHCRLRRIGTGTMGMHGAVV